MGEGERGGEAGGARPRDDLLVDELTRWLAATRVDAAAASRAREHWLRMQEDEDATFAGVLLDLAERGEPVVVESAGQRRLTVTVRAVADDFCAVQTWAGDHILLAYAGIAALRPMEPGRAASGTRGRALDMTLAEALTALVGERMRVLVITRDGTNRVGQLRSCGRDVMVLRPDGEPRDLYVPLGSVAEVSLVG